MSKETYATLRNFETSPTPFSVSVRLRIIGDIISVSPNEQHFLRVYKVGSIMWKCHLDFKAPRKASHNNIHTLGKHEIRFWRLPIMNYDWNYNNFAKKFHTRLEISDIFSRVSKLSHSSDTLWDISLSKLDNFQGPINFLT